MPPTRLSRVAVDEVDTPGREGLTELTDDELTDDAAEGLSMEAKMADRAADTSAPTRARKAAGARQQPRRARETAHMAVEALPLNATQRRFLRSFAAELMLRDPHGAQLARVDDPRALARETAASAVGAASVWEKHLGAFYDAEGVRELLGRRGGPVTRQAVSKRKGLLALTTGSGRVVYPSFQFLDRSPVVGLDKVLAALPESLVSRWTVASWLASPQRELGGECPIDVLARGAVQPVAAAAHGWARSLAA